MRIKIAVIFALTILISSFTAGAFGAEKIDPIEHYIETGEWIGNAEENPDLDVPAYPDTYSSLEEAEAAWRELEEERSIQEWERIDADIKLRRYDELAQEARKDYDEAKNAPPAFASPQGYIMFPYGAVTPRINCRPYRVSDIALEPGEEILGIHAGDTVRWLFAPSVSMQGTLKVSHVIVKPSMPGIATNLMIHTDRRAYQLDLISTETELYSPGIAFTYPDQNLNALFGTSQNMANLPGRGKEKSGDSLDMENINAGYKITTRHKVDWRPQGVFDDGLKTYIRMPVRISEAPAFFITVDKKETLVNYRIKGRYYVVDRLFDRGTLKVGTRTVIITRMNPLADQTVYADEARDLHRRGGDN